MVVVAEVLAVLDEAVSLVAGDVVGVVVVLDDGAVAFVPELL
jgi:hypothetical protein